MKIRLLFVALLCMVNLGLSQTSEPSILIVYYSKTGHTEAMAKAVERGANSVSGIKVVRKSVNNVLEKDILDADAIIIGSPVYNANVAPEIQTFINGWPFTNSPLKDKLGAAFVTSGGFSAGEELVQLNLLHSMLIFGMIVTGGPDWRSAFGASAITSEVPYKGKGSRIDNYFEEKGFALGQRIATLLVTHFK